MSRFPAIPKPDGIVIDVAVPRWLTWVLRLSVGAWIFAILAMVVVMAALGAWISSSYSAEGRGIGLAVSHSAFENRPVEYIVQVTAGDSEAKDLDRDWTLLMSSGSVHWANVVDGPVRLDPGETATLRLTFQFEPSPAEGTPVALRWDPDRKVTASVPLVGHGAQEP